MSVKGYMPKLSDLKPRISVIGVGGAGCNAINNMISSGLQGVDFIVANTDAQALASSSAENRLQLGVKLTEGLGAGSRPEIGEAAAEEAVEDIRNKIEGSHMVFIAAGMGGGTGTGAASVIARVAKELGILTVAVVTKPFLFEGARRMRIAEAGVAELRNHVDTLIVIPNQNLFRIASEKTTFSEAFAMADQVLYSGVACIVDLIIKEGLINLDFADVRTIMGGMGSAMMGTGEASGERRATLAAEEAISNPLLDDVSLRGAKGLLLSITGGKDLTLYEVDEAASRVRQEVDPDANIIVGATFDEMLGDRVRVSIVASGMARAGETERQASGSSEAGPRQAAKHEIGSLGLSNRTDRSASTMASPSHDVQGGPGRQGPHDMQQRLVEALQRPPSRASSFGTPVFGQSKSDEMAPQKAREIWQGPGNVTIEEGPPQLSAGHVPPPIPATYGSPEREHEGFTPARPAEVRRPPRRMPEIGDFPPVGQRAYRAMEAAVRGTRSSLGQDVSWERPQEPRRLSLFERLSGRMRGTSDSEGRKHAGSDLPTSNGYSDYRERHDGAAQDYGDEHEGHARYGGQEAESAGVFGHRRR